MIAPPTLRSAVAEFTAFLDSNQAGEPGSYELVECRFDCIKLVAQAIERSGDFSQDELRSIQNWFRAETEKWLCRSQMIARARIWPEGYPGDYKTIEGVYANSPAGEGVGLHLDRYFLSRTLAVAIRSRARRLSELLAARNNSESSDARWLNLACGPCRELLSIPPPTGSRTITCVDSDANALSYAKNLLAEQNIGQLQFLTENAYRYANPTRNISRFGQLTTIYSAGLFDYIPSARLSTLLGALYQSLATGGVLIAPLKDSRRYETFDYHWGAKWDFFIQREETEFRTIFSEASIPENAVSVERDDSGVILFFVARK